MTRTLAVAFTLLALLTWCMAAQDARLTAARQRATGRQTARGGVSSVVRFRGNTELGLAARRAGARVLIQNWIIGAGRSVPRLPVGEEGLIVGQVRGGKLTTVIQGQRQGRREDEFWTVPRGVVLGIETDDDTAVLQTIVVSPGPDPVVPERAAPRRAEAGRKEYAAYAGGLLARTVYVAEQTGSYDVEIRDLLVGPGQKTEEATLPGAAVFEVRSGSGRLVIDGAGRDLKIGDTLMVDDGRKFRIENGRLDLGLTIRAVLLRNRSDALRGGGEGRAARADRAPTDDPHVQRNPGDFHEDRQFVSPPTLQIPIYACTSSVVVKSFIPGAKIEVFLQGNPTPIASETHWLSSGEVIGVSTTFTAGQVVEARQTFGGATSGPSNAVPVTSYLEDYPDGVPEPRLAPTPLLECGRAVGIQDVIPGAWIKIFAQNPAMGGGFDPAVEIGNTTAPAYAIVAPFVNGARVWAVSGICTATSPPSAVEIVQPAPASVPAPTLDPVQEGSHIVVMRGPGGAPNVPLNGATLEVLDLNRPAAMQRVGGQPTPGGAGQQIFIDPPVNASADYRPTQALCKVSNLGDPPTFVPCADLPPAKIKPPLPGETEVTVTESVPGSEILVFASDGEIGDAGAPVVPLRRALVAGETITILQRVGTCDSRFVYVTRVDCMTALGGEDAACSGEWPMFRHNTLRTAQQTQPSVLADPNQVKKLKVKWSFTPTGARGFRASAIVYKGKVYIGNGNGRLYALDAATGAQLWQYPPASDPPLLSQFETVGLHNASSLGIAASAAIGTVENTDAVIFGAPDPSIGRRLGSGRLFALNALTGGVLWKSPEIAVLNGLTEGSESQLHEQIGYSSPLVYKDRVYVGIADHADSPIQNGKVVAVTLASGSIVPGFNYKSTTTRGGGIWSSVAGGLSDGVFITTGNTRNWNFGSQPEPSVNHGLSMLRLDRNTGSLIWKLQPVPFALDGDPDWASGPTLISTGCGPMVVSTMKDGWTYAVNAGTGTPAPVSVAWQFPATGFPFTTTDGTTHGDSRYLVPGAGWNDVFITMTGGESVTTNLIGGYARLHALNVCAGRGDRIRWIVDVPSTGGGGAYSLGPPTVTRGIVFVGTRQGHLVAIADPSVYPTAKSRCSNTEVPKAACMAGGNHLVPDPIILKDIDLNPAMGSDSIFTEPVLAGGRVFVATSGVPGTLYMLEPEGVHMGLREAPARDSVAHRGPPGDAPVREAAAREATGNAGGADAAEIAYFGPTDSDAWRGVLQGMEEANVLGRFTGSTFRVRPRRFEEVTAPERPGRPIAVLAALDAESLQRLLETLAGTGVPVFNLTADDDGLRGSKWPKLLHIPPSAAMKRGAVAQWRAGHGDAPVEAQAWHPDFAKFGGRELNNRFREGAHRPMTSDAWAGWAALKLLAETVARTRSAQSERILAYVRSDLEFDGQKGALQSFDASGQLRQPLLIVDGGSVAGEVELVVGSPRAVESGASTFRVFVTNEKDGTLAVIDSRSRKVEATVPVGKRPRGVGFSPDHAFVYVALGDENCIAVLDTRTLAVLRKLPCGSDPEAFAVHPNGNIYLSNEDANKVTVLDPASGRTIASIPVGIEPEGVGISPDGSRVMVTSESTSMIHAIRVPEHEVMANVLVAARPREVTFTADGRHAYVTSEVAGKVSKLDALTNTVLQEVRLEIPKVKPKGVLLSPDQKTLYVSTGRAGVVAVLDAESLKLRATIPVGRLVWGLALSRDGSTLYACNGLDDSVSLVDTATNRTLASIPVGAGPWGAVIDDGVTTHAAATLPAGDVVQATSPSAERAGAAAAAEDRISPLVAVGWKLFVDPLLSRTKTFACASCHNPNKNYTDGLRRARGPYGDTLPRRTPPLVNLQRAESLFWDGRASTLEEQALVPLTNPIEMNLTVPEIVARVGSQPHYRKAFQGLGVREIGVHDITGAIAAFERSLRTGPTPFDRWLQGDASALNASQQRGRLLFFTRGQCATCHSGPDLTDGGYHNTGTGTLNDLGRFLVSGKQTDKGKFKTPSLRNWKRAGPLLHDGRFTTIWQMIEWYNTARKAPVGESELDPLALTDADKKDLSAFLDALNGAWPDVSRYAEAWRTWVGGRTPPG